MITGVFIELACKSKSCAPPPVGTGGSAPAGAAPSGPVAFTASKVPGMSKDDWAATKQSRTSVMDYYEERGYKYVNGVLRGTTFDEFVNDPNNPWAVKKLDEVRRQWDGASEQIGWLDKAFSKAHRLSRDTLLYRGMVIPNDPNGLLGALKPGAVLTDKGFVSTSIYPDTAVGFTSRDPASKQRGDVPVIFEIVAPKGTRVVAGSLLEQEVVLNRGTSLRIVKVSNPYPNSPEQVRVEAEVVNDQA